MKNLSKTIVSVVVAFLLVGCGTEERKAFYDDGKVNYVAHYDKKNLLQDEYKKYAPSGELIIDAVYKDNAIINGFQKEPLVDKPKEVYYHMGNQYFKLDGFNVDYTKNLTYKDGKIIKGYEVTLTRTLATDISGMLEITYISEIVQWKDGVSNKIQIYEWENEEALLACLKINSSLFQKMKNPSEKIQLAAIQIDAKNLLYIEKPSNSLKMEAVKKNGHALQYIKEATDEIKLAAIDQNPFAIQYIENSSEQMQTLAVKRSAEVVSF